MNTNLKQLVRWNNFTEYSQHVNLNHFCVSLVYEKIYLLIFNNRKLKIQESVKMRLIKYIIV